MTKRIFSYIILLLITCGSLTTAYCQPTELALAADYWNRGEKEKAYQLYKQLSKEPGNLALVYPLFYNALLELAKYKEAIELSDRMMKRSDDFEINFKLDYGYAYLKSGDLIKADKIFKELISTIANQQYQIKNAAEFFIIKGIPQYAEQAYRAGRAAAADNSLYALELGNALRVQNKKTEMVEEYLNYATTTPGNTAYIKNLLQYLLTRPEEQSDLQKILITRIQRYPDSEVYADLIIWTFLQQKNFYGAFIQSKAYDKKFGKGTPSKTYELAQISLNNKDYNIATRCFEFIVKEFSRSDIYVNARLGLIRANEASVKSSYPVNQDSIRLLIKEYKNFCNQFPEASVSFDAQINGARLYAFYVNQPDSAQILLNELIDNPKVSSPIKAKAKLELGDIYLIRNEPWEATLLFSQVEKMQKDAPIGYEAKLRNARLSYFKGEFGLAEEHLDILEQATSREIANDALELSLKISENTIADTLGIALCAYSAAELLLYQNKEREALQLLELIKSPNKQVKFHRSIILPSILQSTYFKIEVKGDSVFLKPIGEIITKPITDDVYWLEANIRRRSGEFLKAAELLKKITEEYPVEILADDAFFMRAEIFERDLRNHTEAQELYRQFLVQYPGSVYTAEARKRFRQLRGDFTEQVVN